jgi:hypothetical protein
MLRKIMFPIVLIIFITFFYGCGGSGGSSGSNGAVTLNLTGFPFGINSEYLSSWYMEIYVWRDDSAIQILQIGKVPTDKPFTKEIILSPDSTDISVFLADADYGGTEPRYFYQIAVKPGVTNYSIAYWLGYLEYFYYGSIRFGISPMLVQNITSNYIANADFDLAPYFLYKVIDIQSMRLNCSMTASTGEVQVVYGDTIDDVANTISGTHTSYSFQTSDKVYNTLYILLRPENYSTTTKATLKLDGVKYATCDFNYLYDMIPSNNPHRIFANTGSKLLYIDPINKIISNVFTLQNSGGCMAYSVTDNKLYIGSNDGLTVWNLENDTESFINNPSITTSYDIEVAPLLRRIYILTSSGLCILNMDTYELIKKDTTICSNEGTNIALDESQQKLFVSASYVEPNLFRYSIANNQLTLEQSVSYGNIFARKILLNPDRNKILYYPCINNTIWDLNPSNFNKNGEWTLENYPSKAAFNNNGEILYCNDFFGSYLYVMNATNYSQIKKVLIPTEEAKFSVNSDDSVLALFSNYDNPYIYFLNTSDINNATISSSMYNSYSVSKTLSALRNSGLHRYPNKLN